MKADAPPVQNLINRIFRCRHRHKTFPFTPRGEDECYAVCLDCGQRIIGANPVLGSSSPPLPAAPLQTPVAEPVRPVAAPDAANTSNPESQKPAGAPLKRRRKQKQKARQPLLQPEAKKEAKDDSRSVFSLRDGRYNLLWVALFAVGLSGGLYFSGNGKPRVLTPAPPQPQRNAPTPGGSSEHAVAHTSQPDERSRTGAPHADIKPAADKSVSGDAPLPPEGSADINLKRRLYGKSSPVILGTDAPAVQELSQHPGRLPELVQSGSLFTVPRGAAIRVQEEQGGVLKVVLLEGSMAGREGWVQASQVTPRYWSGEPGHRSSR